MAKFKDITGQRFGKLTAVKLYPERKLGKAQWICKCDCEKTIVALGVYLRNGKTKTCGCSGGNYKHGGRWTKEYESWNAARARCSDPAHKDYKNYGGRGIIMCEAWKDFSVFLKDMGSRPKGFTLDRHPNQNGNYEPGNCRWIDRNAQARNKRNNRLLTYKDQTKTIAEWCEEYGIENGSALSARIYRLHWSIEKALLTPVKVIYRH